jgi:hypothetical protein
MRATFMVLGRENMFFSIVRSSVIDYEHTHQALENSTPAGDERFAALFDDGLQCLQGYLMNPNISIARCVFLGCTRGI